MDEGAERLGERVSGVAGADEPNLRLVVAGEADADLQPLGAGNLNVSAFMCGLSLDVLPLHEPLQLSVPELLVRR